MYEILIDFLGHLILAIIHGTYWYFIFKYFLKPKWHKDNNEHKTDKC